MDIKLLLILSFIFVHSVSAETVYKTRDAEGNIIFSDVKTEGAEAIEIQEAQSINIPKTDSNISRQTTKLSPKETEYSQFEIIEPENDSTIRSNEGKVNVNLEIAPSLDEKHIIVFYLDGNEVSSGKSQKLALADMDRGSHKITAAIIDEKDRVIKRSNELVFHLRKDSVLFKNRENNVPDSGPVQNNDSSGTSTPTPAL